MMIVRTDTREIISTFLGFRQAFPRVSWVDPVTNEQLIAQGVPARLVTEALPPPLEFGQAAIFTVETQGDGSELQVWAIATRPLSELKATATAAVNQAASDKISTLELARGLSRSPPAARPRTVAVLTKLDEVISRIDTAVDGAAIKVIMDELEAF